LRSKYNFINVFFGASFPSAVELIREKTGKELERSQKKAGKPSC
jgi:hypothetical protein